MAVACAASVAGAWACSLDGGINPQPLPPSDATGQDNDAPAEHEDAGSTGSPTNEPPEATRDAAPPPFGDAGGGCVGSDAGDAGITRDDAGATDAGDARDDGGATDAGDASVGPCGSGS